ncbi:DUF2279 domain-containing protein [Campylobacterota bacterium]
MLRLVIISVLIISCVFGENNSSKKDILYTNLVGMAVITGWGVANWDYGKSKPHAEKEEWFGRNTESGGADKLGHFYSSYFVGSGLSSLYESWGYGKKDAALYGSLSSFVIMNYMEIGDAFSSEFGFSYEDFLMNTFGALSSYFFYINPELSKRIDLRIEYIPSFDTADIVTEYEKMKFLVAFKAEGFDFITNPYLKYSELHVGYYTRNYIGSYSQESERIIYLGVGINLSRLARENDYKKTAHFLNYYQIPYTYIPLEKDLNR